jgi:hypothetical protein
MELLNFYYTGMPILAVNLLFYSITSLSTSITSSQNVFKFIYETTDSDYDIYKRQIESTDLENKLRIVKELVYDILRFYANSAHEFNLLIEEITNPFIISNISSNLEFELVDIRSSCTNVLTRLPESIKISLNSLAVLVEKINDILFKIKKKIQTHNQLYFKSWRNFCLKREISQLKFETDLLDSRFNLLFKILGVYNICIK